MLTFGIVPDAFALILVGALECGIGLSLIAGRGLRVTIYLLGLELLGILSPLLLAHRPRRAGPRGVGGRHARARSHRPAPGPAPEQAPRAMTPIAPGRDAAAGSSRA